MNVKKLLIENLKLLSDMPIPEYTLYCKWAEINNSKWIKEKQQRILEIKSNIWKPKNIDDYKDLDIGVRIIRSKEDILNWKILRTFICTMTWNQSPGRTTRCIVYDKKTKKYLGVISIGSDFLCLKPRDDYFGWTSKERIGEKKLNYLAMGSSIVPTQPLGYNYVGGKLMSLITCSDRIVNEWNNKYKENLVGITTTGLYGGFSQYNSLKYWRKCGTSEGKITIVPSIDVWVKMREYLKKEEPEKYKYYNNRTRSKNNLIKYFFRISKLKHVNNNAPRGVYFCKLFENTVDFLNCKTDNLGKPAFDNKLSSLTNLWKERYAFKRIKNLKKNNRINLTSSLFYDDLVNNSWENVREKYLSKIK